MMSLSSIGGAQDLAGESQRVFRCLLQAMAEPGTIVSAATKLQCPAPLGQAQGVVALTLLDHETPIWLSPRLRIPAVQAFLRFHTGAPLVEDPSSASFALADSVADLPALDLFNLGSDESPERGATLIVETALIAATSGLELRGPGIPNERKLELWGVPDAFWLARAQVCAFVPRGLDFIFTSGDSLTALPRTTRADI
jgi:alpha-D-ribose 1-methylphosphonate 5-triphosphate synthase subunit PhnH